MADGFVVGLVEGFADPVFVAGSNVLGFWVGLPESSGQCGTVKR